MDNGPYTGDLDLAAARTRDDLLALLRTLHIRADSPSLRTLEARTRHTASPLSKTAVAEMLKGVRFPRKAVMVAFVRACGVPDDAIEPWRRAWEQVAASEEAPTQSGAAQAAPGRQAHEVAGQRPLPGTSASSSPGVSDGQTQNAPADRPSGTLAAAEQTEIRQLREEISTLRSLLASVAESAAKSAIPDVEGALQSAQLPDKVADAVATSLKSATSASALDVLVRASIGTLLNERGEVSVPRLLREVAHALPDASPSAISSSLEELRRTGKVSWLGNDVMKAGIIRVHP